jgi:pSer/pThr/pTyr-binding forkhead associated (FHA) protein
MQSENSASTPHGSELTSTIHLSSLRTVPSIDENEESKLSSLTVEDRAIIEDLAPGSAMLIVLAGPNKGARYLLNQELITIGREPASDISLDDITVSRKHCTISLVTSASSPNELTATITDLKSLNGTYVNAIATSSTSLKSGDEIHVGKYRLTYFPALKNQGSK